MIIYGGKPMIVMIGLLMTNALNAQFLVPKLTGFSLMNVPNNVSLVMVKIMILDTVKNVNILMKNV